MAVSDVLSPSPCNHEVPMVRQMGLFEGYPYEAQAGLSRQCGWLGET